MKLIPMLLKEMESEAQTTRKMLGRIPNDQYDWRPHPKSMSVQQLGTHIAELSTWIPMTLTTDELDFANNPYSLEVITNTAALLEYFEKNHAEAKESLQTATEAQLDDLWTLRNGAEIYSTSSKAEVIRMIFSQVVHHRAQMGVFLRLLNIPIPGSYGPSADDLNF